MSYKSYPDTQLIALLKESDKDAFAELYRRYYTLLQNHVYKRLGDIEETKDVLQELFTQIWTKREQLPETSNFTGYLYIIVRNKVFNQLAHQKVATRYLNSLQEYLASAHETADMAFREKEFKAMIDREIDALPPKMREVFRLSRETGLSHKEIAEQLDISENTVSNQISSALKVLRVKLGALFYLLLF